jgi:hypothetical protein
MTCGDGDGGERETSRSSDVAKENVSIGLFGRLPTSVACVVFSYNRGGDYAVLWRTARSVWPLLRLAASSPVVFHVSDLGAFVERATQNLSVSTEWQQQHRAPTGESV